MGTVVVVGSANVDVVVTTRRFPQPGETIQGGSAALLPGGKGANQAVAARRAGAATRFLGCVGDDVFGRHLRSFLEDEGIGLDGLRTTCGIPSGMAVVTVTELGENAIVVVPGANAAVDVDHVMTAARLGAGDVVLVQLEVPEATVATALRAARGAGATGVLNPAPALPIGRDVLALADVLVMNEVELGGYLGGAVDGADDAALLTAVRSLQASPEQRVVVTLGARGVLAVSGREVLRVKGHPTNVVDTTGAGDCFVGVLGAGLVAGDPFGLSVRRANLAGALAVGRRGAGPSMPTAAEIAAAMR
jgi:ribokinase